MQLSETLPRLLERQAEWLGPMPGTLKPPPTKSVVEARLWKLTSIVHSPLKRGIETSLFLIVSSLGFSLTAYSIDQFVTFFQNDSLTQTITSLLR